MIFQLQGTLELIKPTIELVSRDYLWPQLWKFVKEYVQSWDICSRAKGTRHQSYGLLQLLPIPNGPWLSLSLDFNTELPVSCTFDSILVVVGQLTKMAHFIPCNKTITREVTTKLFIDHIYRYHGQPKI
jgi:hypothetical protein